jgi:plasmid maintenance system antidote protein VapI
VPAQRCGYPVFGTSELFWINLQARYDLEVEKDRLGDALAGIRPLSAAS